MKAVLSVLVACAALTAVASAATGPRLAIAEKAPLAVSGTGFPHATRVLVTVTSAKSSLHKAVWVRSSTAGQFTAAFRSILVGPSCQHPVYTVTAKVASKVRATISFTPSSARDCAPMQPVDQ